MELLFVPSDETVRKSRRLLRDWLQRRLGAEDLAWLDAACAAAAEEIDPKRFYLDFSAVHGHAPREPLALRKVDGAAARKVRPGWTPESWTAEEAARALLLLHRRALKRDKWLKEVGTLFENADLGEQVALYRALPLLPHPASHVERCAEGIRSNVTDVFRAVAHGNPYPAENLPEAAWNQMLLKALFVEVGIAEVQGLDERANPHLARMLCDYARERWAASRPVPPELWRCVGPHADEAGLKDLERALDTGDAGTKEAAAEALRKAPWPEARHILLARNLPVPEDDLP
jgi:hypothetical protein